MMGVLLPTALLVAGLGLLLQIASASRKPRDEEPEEPGDPFPPPVPRRAFPTTGSSEVATPRSRSRPGLTRAEAEDLLDWLEAHGLKDLGVSLEQSHTFCVRYCC